jgi:hypothetical protein
MGKIHLEIDTWQMKAAFLLIGLLILTVVVIVYRNRTEKYEVVYSVFLSVTDDQPGMPAGAICYCNKELRDALGNKDIPELAKLFDFNLDSADLFACIIRNHTIDGVVGRGDLGFGIFGEFSG